jgi:hypothetical protein
MLALFIIHFNSAMLAVPLVDPPFRIFPAGTLFTTTLNAAFWVFGLSVGRFSKLKKVIYQVYRLWAEKKPLQCGLPTLVIVRATAGGNIADGSATTLVNPIIQAQSASLVGFYTNR